MSHSPTMFKVHTFCPIQVTLAGAQLQLKDLVCNASMLGQFLTVDRGEASMNDLQTQLCNLPADILQEAERLFLSQLDFSKFFTVGISGQGNLQNRSTFFTTVFCLFAVTQICFVPDELH